jgi:hypothetical protein
MCNVSTFLSQDLIFESQQNEWIKAMHRNKMKIQEQE